MYREWPTSVPGAVLWHHPAGRGPIRRRILPDGCMDLIWDGRGFFIAGPDSAARMHEVPDGVGYVGLRLSGGLGPALLGLPADELRDQRPDLDEVWRPGVVRDLGERAVDDPIQALTDWVVEQTARTRPRPARPRDPHPGDPRTLTRRVGRPPRADRPHPAPVSCAPVRLRPAAPEPHHALRRRTRRRPFGGRLGERRGRTRLRRPGPPQPRGPRPGWRDHDDAAAGVGRAS